MTAWRAPPGANYPLVKTSRVALAPLLCQPTLSQSAGETLLKPCIPMRGEHPNGGERAGHHSADTTYIGSCPTRELLCLLKVWEGHTPTHQWFTKRTSLSLAQDC